MSEPKVPKPRTEAQLASFEKCLAARKRALERKQDAPIKEEIVQSKPVTPPEVDQRSSPIIEQEPEETEQLHELDLSPLIEIMKQSNDHIEGLHREIAEMKRSHQKMSKGLIDRNIKDHLALNFV